MKQLKSDRFFQNKPKESFSVYQMLLLHKNFNESELHRKICMNFDILNIFPICYFATF